jgi:hypothetical protein
MLINSVGINYFEEYNKPLFIKHKNHSDSILISLNTFPEDCMSKSGIIKARKQFLQALKNAVETLNVRIVLLAASTKRLFGKEIELMVNWDGKLDNTGFTLRELYPEILFTNGDNGTAAILNMEIDSILHKAEIHSGNNTVIINGLGLLGHDSLQYLLEKNLRDEQIIVISNYTKDLKETIAETNIKVFPNIMSIDIDDLNKISSIINCTHNSVSLITADCIDYIQNGQTIYVVDVAVPYGFPEDEFIKCKNVQRQDGGNAFIENGLEFWFNPEICGLTDNVLYGCFAETMCLAAHLKENPDDIEYIRSLDLFNVNKTTKEFVKGLFGKYGVGIAPEPLSYMKPISKNPR